MWSKYSKHSEMQLPDHQVITSYSRLTLQSFLQEYHQSLVIYVTVAISD